jgi:hypothetical protein
MRSHSLSRLEWKDIIKMGFTEVACDDGKLSFIVQYGQYEVAAFMYFNIITFFHILLVLFFINIYGFISV